MNDLIYHPSMATYACVRVLSLWSSLVMVSKGNRSGRLAICSSRTGERSTRSPSFLREVINPCGRGTQCPGLRSSRPVSWSARLGWAGVVSFWLFQWRSYRAHLARIGRGKVPPCW
jgi:hypothetical protein